MPKPSSTAITTDATADTLSNATLLDQIMAETKLVPAQEGYQIARQGVSAFITEILKSNDPDQLINKHRADQMIAEIDRMLGKQMDAILHQPEFQQLESSWRSLKLLVDRTDFRENIKLEVLHVTKEDLLDDFENAADITCSGIYKHVYTAGYGQFGGEPVAAMVGNYNFGPSSPDIKLLSYMASVGAMSHAPFLAAPAPEFFNLNSFEELPNLKEIKDLFAGPRHAKWRAFRESEDARHVALTGPRFMLRSAYHPQEQPIESFNYNEDIAGQHDNYLWGNSAFLLASCINDSFARYRWCPNIIGPQSGGAVEDLPVHLYESLGQLQAKIPTEVLISDRKEFELAEEGFIALTMRKDSDNAAFFSANSVQKPKHFPKTPEGLQAQTNYKLGTCPARAPAGCGPTPARTPPRKCGSATARTCGPTPSPPVSPVRQPCANGTCASWTWPSWLAATRRRPPSPMCCQSVPCKPGSKTSSQPSGACR
ncbi:Hypothetical protein, conserved [Pseudomonas putida BIRD-1]|nr:Hypothetical protein, conserved [Pseudomonas putida BIRD-1]